MKAEARKITDIVNSIHSIIDFQSRSIKDTDLVSREAFVGIRSAIANAIGVDCTDEFKGKFRSDLEYIDISVAIEGVSYYLEYSESMPDSHVFLKHEDGVNWCRQILSSMDGSAAQ